MRIRRLAEDRRSFSRHFRDRIDELDGVEGRRIRKRPVGYGVWTSTDIKHPGSQCGAEEHGRIEERHGIRMVGSPSPGSGSIHQHSIFPRQINDIPPITGNAQRDIDRSVRKIRQVEKCVDRIDRGSICPEGGVPHRPVRGILVRQLDSVVNNRVAIARVNAPGILRLHRKRQMRGFPHRLGPQIPNVTPGAIVILRVDSHGEADRSRSTLDLHRHIESGEVGRVDCDRIVDSGRVL